MGQVCIVTGAASGIGRALATQLVQRGDTVLLADLAEAVHEVAAELDAAGPGRAESRVLDVTDAEAFAAAVAGQVEAHGRLDLLVNNAGIGTIGLTRDVPLDDFRRVVEVNLFGTMNGVAAAYPRMIDQGSGHIVNVASMAGLVPVPASAGYVASKHAVVGLSQSLRVEAAPLGVRVSVVCPAAVDTPIYDTNNFVGIDRGGFKAMLPGKPMTAARCAEIVLRGVAKNRAVITPGIEGSLMWWVHRHLPALTGLMMRSMGGQLRALRDQGAAEE